MKIKQIVGIVLLSMSLICGCSDKDAGKNNKSLNDETSDVIDILDTSNVNTVLNNIDEEVYESFIDTTNTINEKSTDTSSILDEQANENSISMMESINTTNETVAEKPIVFNINNSNGEVKRTVFSAASEVNLNRPTELKGTEVFIGWKEDDELSNLSDKSFDTNKDISLTIESKDIGNTENAIYNDTIYTDSECEYVEIPIVVGGNTNFAVLDLEVIFDTKLFSFDSFTYTDVDAVCNCVEDGKIIVSFVSMENIQGDVNICNVKLKNVAKQDVETKLDYNIKDIAAWNNNSTEYVNVKCEVVNDKIVVY